jgi:hypothetical protein
VQFSHEQAFITWHSLSPMHVYLFREYKYNIPIVGSRGARE